MKTKTFLIILLIILVLAVGGFFGYKELQKRKTKKTNPDPPTPKPAGKTGDPHIAELQKKLNKILPADYPKLIVDGIWGPKTQAAFEYANRHKLIGQKEKNTLDLIVRATPVLGDMIAGAELAKHITGKAWNWFKNTVL